MVKICPYCGFENQDIFNFCANCGRPLLINKQSNLDFGSNFGSNFGSDFGSILGIDKKKLILFSYIITIAFSWGALLFNLIFNTIFSGFGFFGFVGLFLPFYLIQSKDPSIRKHGYIQIVIALLGIFLSVVYVFRIFNLVI